MATSDKIAIVETKDVGPTHLRVRSRDSSKKVGARSVTWDDTESKSHSKASRIKRYKQIEKELERDREIEREVEERHLRQEWEADQQRQREEFAQNQERRMELIRRQEELRAQQFD